MADFNETDFFFDHSLVNDPYPYFEYLRAQGPVVYLPKHNVLAVTGYDEGVEVLRDHQTYSSINSATGPLPPIPFTPDGDDITEQIQRHRHQMSYGSMLVAQDPPVHTRMRTLIAPLLTPKRLSENEAFIHRSIESQIDGFIDQGRFEAVSEFAYPLATLTIADLMGVPAEDHQKFLPLLGKLPGRIGGDDAAENNPMMQVGMFFYQYLAERRQQPRGDVLTLLAQAKYPNGEEPDIQEVTTHAATMYGAGQDTTVRLIAASLKTLAENPAIQDQLRYDRGLIAAFVEEVLRMDGPVKSTYRLAKKKTTLGGVAVAPGTVIMLAFGAMSRDPRKFDAPYEFRLDRNNMATQIAFSKGVHTCIGAPLARTEAREALVHIFDRLEDIRIDEKHHGPCGARHFDYEPNYTQRALCAVHLTFKKIA